jgi:hypothetical protein
LIQIHKQNRINQKKKDEETNKLKMLAECDKKERLHMKADKSKSNQLSFGCSTKTVDDIRPKDVKGKGGGG